MNSVKNFIYNISDILVAFLIIVVAILIIGWRVNAIMDYPSQILAVQEEQNNTSSSEQTGSASADQTSQGSGSSSEPVTVTVVQNNTVDDIASSLVNAGIISDPQEFVSAVEAAGAATNLKYGTYEIPADATMDQIIQMMTS